MSKFRLTLLLLVLVLVLMTTYGSAVSIQFADTSLTGPQEIDVYFVNGTHYLTTNTTSQFSTEDSVIIHISPEQQDYLRDPELFINKAGDFISDNVIPIAFIAMVIGLLVVKR